MGELASKVRGLAGRASVRNGLWMYLLQAFNTIIPLLTLPYVTRILGSAGYGYFSIALNIFGYLQVLVEYGFGMSATRKVAISDNDHDLVEQTFSRVIAARLGLTGVCVLLGLCYGVANGMLAAQSICLAIMFIAILGSCLDQSWLFQGMQDMRFISIINIVGRTISTVLIFLLVKQPGDLYLYSILYSVSPLVAGTVGVVVAKRSYGLRFAHVTPSGVFDELKDGFYVFTTQLSSKVFGAVGVTILGVVASASTVGVYSAIQKVPNIIMLAWMPVSQVLYPISSRRLNKSFEEGIAFIYKVRRYIMVVFGAMCLVIAVFSRPIVSLAFGEGYEEYHYWVIPLLGWLLAGINNNFLGIQILLGAGYDKTYSKCFQLGVAITIACNVLLVMLFGGDGASVAPLISELALSLLLWREVRRIRREDQPQEDEAE